MPGFDPLAVLMGLPADATATAAAPAPIPPVAPPSVPMQPRDLDVMRAEAGTKPGRQIDWMSLIKLAAPAIGMLAARGDGGDAAFMHGWTTGSSMATEEQRRKLDEEGKRRTAGAEYLMKIGENALGIDDPVLFDEFLRLAEDAGVKAGYVKPGELKGAINFPQSKIAGARLKEINARLDALQKDGYNLDDLAEGGSRIELQDGSSVLVGSALDLTQRRPKDVSGKIVPRPKAAPKPENRDKYESQLDDLVAIWQAANPGKSVPPNVRARLRVQAEQEIGRARNYPPARVTQGASPLGGLTNSGGADLTGDAFLQTLAPADRALVQQIAEYKMDIARVTSLRGNERTRIARLVAQYDPSFDMSQYGSRAQLRKDFASGKAAANVRSLNTAVGHLKSLKDAGDQLQNSNFTLWNQIANAGLSATGDPRVVRFNTAATAVEGELAAVFKGMGATDQEIKVWRDNLNASQSPAQLKAAIEQAIDLMGSRLQALHDQFTSGMGRPKDFKLLSAKSRQILSGLGIDVDAIDPGGAVKSDSTVEEWVRDPKTGTLVRKAAK